MGYVTAKHDVIRNEVENTVGTEFFNFCQLKIPDTVSSGLFQSYCIMQHGVDFIFVSIREPIIYLDNGIQNPILKEDAFGCGILCRNLKSFNDKNTLFIFVYM